MALRMAAQQHKVRFRIMMSFVEGPDSNLLTTAKDLLQDSKDPPPLKLSQDMANFFKLTAESKSATQQLLKEMTEMTQNGEEAPGKGRKGAKEDGAAEEVAKEAAEAVGDKAAPPAPEAGQAGEAEQAGQQQQEPKELDSQRLGRTGAWAGR